MSFHYPPGCRQDDFDREAERLNYEDPYDASRDTSSSEDRSVGQGNVYLRHDIKITISNLEAVSSSLKKWADTLVYKEWLPTYFNTIDLEVLRLKNILERI